MGRLPILLLAMSALAGCSPQTFIELSPSMILPSPPPSAPISQWTTTPGRTTVTVQRDGVTLRGFHYAGATPHSAAILFFNGNGMTVAAADSLYRALAKLGPDVFVYDYRGYGFSTGTPDLFAYRADALSLYDTLASITPGHRVFVYGFSMGTALAAYIASQRQPTGVILAAPIASAEAEFPIYAALLGYQPASIANARPSPEAKDIFGEATLLTKSTAPLLVLHGTEDRIVPIGQGREVLASGHAREKRMVELPGVGHNETPSEPAAFTAIKEFVTAAR